jgi:hypothetical protein
MRISGDGFGMRRLKSQHLAPGMPGKILEKQGQL